ncbi:MAG: SOSS complex subunit B family protein [archaeon]
MVKIADVRSMQGSVEGTVEAEVVELGETREFNKFGKSIKVANATLKDDTGTIQLSLWNDDISKVNKGDTVKITNGYVKEFQGDPQLTAGKFGKLEVAGGEGGEAKEEAETEEVEEEKVE